MSFRDELKRLDGDEWRKSNPFSPEITTVCEVLHNPYARDDERKLALRGWLAKHQPCVFGQVAAKADKQYIIVIDEALIDQGDEAVKAKLLLEKQTWKQWSLEGGGKHGLLVVFASPALHFAAPNQALRAVCQYARSLFIDDAEADSAGNDVCHDWLYLKRPKTTEYVKFRVILDFFASAGDKRWWHDHRFPGGVAFTLNSLGHMARTKEWYENLSNPVEWSSRLAMLTISNAFDHSQHGRATHLLDLNAGTPFKPMACPFSSPEKLPEALRGKDWTTYSGSHHTDHSVRAEFFHQSPTPDHSRGDYLLDFMYVAGTSQLENIELMRGVPITESDLFDDIGAPETWRYKKPAVYAAPQRPDADAAIAKALSICKAWLAE